MDSICRKAVWKEQDCISLLTRSNVKLTSILKLLYLYALVSIAVGISKPLTLKDILIRWIMFMSLLRYFLIFILACKNFNHGHFHVLFFFKKRKKKDLGNYNLSDAIQYSNIESSVLSVLFLSVKLERTFMQRTFSSLVALSHPV